MITERARRILSEGAYDNPDGENTVIVAEGETTTVFRVFRARHTLYDPPERGDNLAPSITTTLRKKGTWSTSSWRPAHARDSLAALPFAKRFPAKN